MGLLGLSLVFVGIVLVINGYGMLQKIDGKSISIMNIITGVVLVIGNLLALSVATEVSAYVNVTSGLLFGFTYIFIALNHLLKLDLRPFGVYCGFVAVYAIVMSFVSFRDAMPLLGVLWMAWAILWLEGFLEFVVKLKIGKVYPYLAIAEGIFAAFIPAMLMLLEIV